MRLPLPAIGLLLICHAAWSADTSTPASNAAQSPPAATAAGLRLVPGAWEFAPMSFILPDAQLARATHTTAAPAYELASGLGLQVERKRRRFRQRAVNWVTDQSEPAGWLTDFLLDGDDSGWHLVMDPTGDDQYLLEFNMQFR